MHYNHLTSVRVLDDVINQMVDCFNKKKAILTLMKRDYLIMTATTLKENHLATRLIETCVLFGTFIACCVL